MVLLCLSFIYARGPGLSNDAYQYLSVAQNIKDHGQIATSIVYFDAERTSRRLPAPETTSPPGYPIAIDLLSLLSIKQETAGWILSLFGVTGVIPLLWWGAGILGATDGTKRVGLAIWLFNSHVIIYGTGISTDAIFTFIVLAGLALLLFVEVEERPSSYLVPLGMLLLGVSYWIRYAGVFVVAGVCVYSVWRLIAKRPRVTLWMASLAGSIVIIACDIARNAYVVGTVGVQRGGIHHPLPFVLRKFAAVWYHLFLGSYRAHFGPTNAVITLCLIVTMLIFLSNHRLAPTPNARKFRAEILGIVVVVYSAGIIYAQTYTPLELGPRYFFPLIPILILLMVWAFSRFGPLNSLIAQNLVPLLAIILICAYAIENINDARRTDAIFPHTTLASYFAESTEKGVSASMWVQRNIPARAAIVATEGQATAYLLQRSTICLASREYTNQYWNEDSVHKLMQTYNAAFLIVYPGLPAANDSDSVQQDSEFVHTLLSEKHPGWLALAARGPHVIIYQLHY